MVRPLDQSQAKMLKAVIGRLSHNSGRHRRMQNNIFLDNKITKKVFFMAACELELVCPHCQATEICGPAQMLARLRSLALLRREGKPEMAMLVELFRCSISKFSCHACDRVGLHVREPSADGWGEARACVDCSSRIPAERLELFPDAKRCAACEARSHDGEGPEREFCSKCGTVLILKLRRGGGIARYEMNCPQCRS